MAKTNESYHMPSLRECRLTGGMLFKRQETNRTVTFAAIEQKSIESGHTAYMSGRMDPACSPQPHPSWGNDIFKWIEGVSYSLMQHPDPESEKKIDAMIETIAATQWPDGYWNPYFTFTAPGQRWKHIDSSHELFTAGHLISAAVAYYRATGKDRFLVIARRFADCIAATFGSQPGQLRGYDGHQGVKMALMDLYEETGDKRYMKSAAFFMRERGAKPRYFDQLHRQEDGPGGQNDGRDYFLSGPYTGLQAHKPISEQDTAEGHAVRYIFQMVGVTDLALETADKALWELVYKAWKDIVEKKMYLTGGIGSTNRCEAFSYAYDLNNELAYNETCGSVYMLIWGYKLLQRELCGAVGDVMELELYNTVLAGVSLSGDKFFYCNPLAVYPQDYAYANNRMFSQTPGRMPGSQPLAVRPIWPSCWPRSLGMYAATAAMRLPFTSIPPARPPCRWAGKR